MICIIKKLYDDWPWLKYALDAAVEHSSCGVNEKTFIIFALRPFDRRQLSKTKYIKEIIYFPHTTPLDTIRTRNVFAVIKRIILEPNLITSTILTFRKKLKCKNLIVFNRDDVDFIMLEREYKRRIAYKTLQVINCSNPDKFQFETSKNKLVSNYFLWIDQPVINDAVLDRNTLREIMNSKIKELEKLHEIKHFIVVHPRSDGEMRKILEERLNLHDYLGNFTPGTVLTLFSQLAACWVDVSDVEFLGSFPEQKVLRKKLFSKKL